MKKGSRTGYLRLPQRVVCSRIWATPVSSMGTVRNATIKAFSSLSLRKCKCLAPVAVCRYWSTVTFSAAIGRLLINWNAEMDWFMRYPDSKATILPVFGAHSGSLNPMATGLAYAELERVFA